MKNLLKNIPRSLHEELFETLVRNESIHIERIVSRGHTTPAGEWYDQDRSEFVVVLKGSGKLEFEDGRAVSLEAGDWLEIPARVKHRVAWTAPDSDTIWLAVHYL
jgi:cupin 2 domain-containing protein